MVITEHGLMRRKKKHPRAPLPRLAGQRRVTPSYTADLHNSTHKQNTPPTRHSSFLWQRRCCGARGGEDNRTRGVHCTSSSKSTSNAMSSHACVATVAFICIQGWR